MLCVILSRILRGHVTGSSSHSLTLCMLLIHYSVAVFLNLCTYVSLLTGVSPHSVFVCLFVCFENWIELVTVLCVVCS